jgi:flagellar biogenesis protein FliO
MGALWANPLVTLSAIMGLVMIGVYVLRRRGHLPPARTWTFASRVFAGSLWAVALILTTAWEVFRLQ